MMRFVVLLLLVGAVLALAGTGVTKWVLATRPWSACGEASELLACAVVATLVTTAGPAMIGFGIARCLVAVAIALRAVERKTGFLP